MTLSTLEPAADLAVADGEICADPAPRLRVRVLSALQLERDGERQVFGGKAPRKPLELLALLAAHSGRPVDAHGVIDELWPSLDADAPRASLDMAVCRLRRLLDDADAVRCSGGSLWLCPRRVWTDVAAFEAQAHAADVGSDHAPWQALALYRGPLLGDALVGGRLLARRQQLARRLVDVALAAAHRLLAGGAAEQAVRLLNRALDGEPLSEPLHRALMQAQLAQGERAEVLRSWQRCDALLRLHVGVPPAASTAALAARARAA